jgi:hypothetical protein
MSCPCSSSSNSRSGPARFPSSGSLPTLSDIKAFRSGQPAVPYVVRSLADLRMLLRPQAILRPFLKPGVLVRIPELSPAECQAWEQRLTPLVQECGCNAGTLAVGIFLALSVLAAFFTNIPDDFRFPLQTYLIGSACFVAGLILSAFIGKLSGQVLAALRLHRACQELETALNLEPGAFKTKLEL